MKKSSALISFYLKHLKPVKYVVSLDNRLFSIFFNKEDIFKRIILFMNKADINLLKSVHRNTLKS